MYSPYPGGTFIKKDREEGNVNEAFENNYRSRLKLTNEQVFYWVYGMDTEESKRALIALLNVVLDRKDDPIVEVRLLNPVQKGFVIGDKLTVMDVKCETSSGELIDVEMQRSLRSLLQSLSFLPLSVSPSQA